MKRFAWTIAVPLLVLAPCAYAGSTPTFNIAQATVFVFAGSDNVQFTFAGPGTAISGSGGIQCQITWCDSQLFPSGSFVQTTFGFDGQIFIDSFATATIGGHDFDPNTLSLSGLALNTWADLEFGHVFLYGLPGRRYVDPGFRNGQRGCHGHRLHAANGRREVLFNLGL